MVERIRDATVAEELAAQAGTDATPELVLGDVLTPVIFAPQRPPLAQSGYVPGTLGQASAAAALNTSHVGIFGSGVGRSIVRVNWAKVFNDTASGITVSFRRLDGPFTGFPSVRAVPGYINAGNPNTGGCFSVTKNDTVGAQGVFMATVFIQADSNETFWGPWILNDGALLVAHGTVNVALRAAFGYELWPAIRVQPPG